MDLLGVRSCHPLFLWKHIIQANSNIKIFSKKWKIADHNQNRRSSCMLSNTAKQMTLTGDHAINDWHIQASRTKKIILKISCV